MTFATECPMTAEIRMANNSGGKASCKSTRRMMTISVDPPAYPASSPSAVPEMPATITVTGATRIETRAPWMT